MRSGSAEAEDAPLVVDDRGNAVDDVTVGADGSVKEREREREREKEAAEPTEPDAGPAEDTPAADESARVEKLADIGGQRKKRKIGKIIGADADEEDADGEKGKNNMGSRPKSGNAPPTDTKDGSGAAAKAKAKKKAKKVKLSFGDDEG